MEKYFLIPAYFLGIFILVGRYNLVLASNVYFEQNTAEYRAGDLFPVAIRLDAVGVPINAAELTINFDVDKLEIVSFKKDESVFTFWPKGVDFSNTLGVLRILAGLPNPGFSGTGGLVLTVYFRGKNIGEGKVEIDGGSSRVLLNDGNGTEDTLSLGVPLLVNILEKTSATTPSIVKTEETSGRLAGDFQPMAFRDDAVFGGRHFLIFPGDSDIKNVYKYEVQIFKDNEWGEWRQVESPHALDIIGGERVFVRAVGVSGDEIVREVNILEEKKNVAFRYIPLFLALIIFLFSCILFRKLLKKESRVS